MTMSWPSQPRRAIALVTILSALGFSRGSQASATDLGAIKTLIDEKKYSAAESLVRLRLSLDLKASDPDKLRLYLLQALIEAHQDRGEAARQSLLFAKELYKAAPAGSSLKADERNASRYLSEIEMTEYDIRALGEKP